MKANVLARQVCFSTPVNAWLTLSVLRHGVGDPTTRRDGPVLWRTSLMSSGAVTYALTQVGPRQVDARGWGPGGAELLESVDVLLGAQDDPCSFETRHPVVADAHRRYSGLRVPLTGRLLEALIPAVLEQKVVSLDAFAAWRRLVTRFGTLPPGPAPAGMRLFPTAEAWASIPSWEWHRAGVDPRRARTVQAVARVASQLERLAAAHPHDLPTVYRGLQSIPGVGAWTAAEVGARALGDADAVSFGDYHLGALVGSALMGRRLVRDDEIAEVLEPWRPHRRRVVRLLELSRYTRPERRGPRMPRVDHRLV